MCWWPMMPLEAKDPLVAEDSRVLVEFLGVENIPYQYLFIFFLYFIWVLIVFFEKAKKVNMKDS